jgi:kynurenine formamidase
MNSEHRLFVLLCGGFMSFATISGANAQTLEAGEWWPHPIWGADDQAGASNWVTPEKVLEAVSLVKTGKIYELGQIYDHEMPLFGQRTYALYIPGSPTGGPFGDNGVVWHDEVLTTEIGQVGTQFDGPGHIGIHTTMADGTVKDLFYNGTPLEEMKGTYGLLKLGIENIKPYVTRGILIDIAGLKGVDALDHSYEVTVSDVKAALKRQGMSEKDVRDGDALFFRYGWSMYWTDADKYNTNPPGIGLEVAAWIVEQNASMFGSDQWNSEVTPNPNPNLAFPVHTELIAKHGIWNLENMVYDELIEDQVFEFMFVFTPIRFRGGTGSPGRPIAIR